MIANAMLIALAVLLACMFLLMGELKFLLPYKRTIFHQYGIVLLVWLGILFGNLFVVIYWIQRKFLLKDTGMNPDSETKNWAQLPRCQASPAPRCRIISDFQPGVMDSESWNHEKRPLAIGQPV